MIVTGKKAAAFVAVGALFAGSADAFLPSAIPCPATVVGASNQCASSVMPIRNLASPAATHRRVASSSSRAARTSLFSAPAARNEAAPVMPSGVVAKAKTTPKKKAGPIKVAGYFGLWYLFNIGYNIYNKRVLNVCPLPWSIAAAQLGIGLLYVFPLWLTTLRKAPKLAKGALRPLRFVVYEGNSTVPTKRLLAGFVSMNGRALRQRSIAWISMQQRKYSGCSRRVAHFYFVKVHDIFVA